MRAFTIALAAVANLAAAVAAHPAQADWYGPGWHEDWHHHHHWHPWYPGFVPPAVVVRPPYVYAPPPPVAYAPPPYYGSYYR